MRRVALAVWLAPAALAGCADAPDVPPCDAPADLSLEMAPSDLDFGVFQDGDDLAYGTPPQGGAPYSPFHARATGLPTLDEGAVVGLHAEDAADGTDLGDVEYDVRFVCANVGDSAGTWTGSDLHLRFFGWSLEDLQGRDAAVTMTVSDLDGNAIDATILGHLVQM